MKKVFATITLATIMMFGSLSSFAGIIISDKAEPAGCTQDSKEAADGIIIFGKDGIIIFGIVLIGGDGCDQKNGIIISD